jgi:hypothetical protein
VASRSFAGRHAALLVRWQVNGKRYERRPGEKSFRFFFFFFFLLFLFSLFDAGLLVRILFLLVLIVFGNDDEMHRVSLRHFQLDVALRTTQDLAFLYFIFVQVNLCVAFRTLGHEDSLLPGVNLHRRAYYITPGSSFSAEGI